MISCGFGSPGEIGHCVIPGCTGGCDLSNCSDGSKRGISNLSRTGFRNWKLQDGSFPGLLTLPGIHLSGKAATISQKTVKIVTNMAITTSQRNPFKLRNRNL